MAVTLRLACNMTSPYNASFAFPIYAVYFRPIMLRDNLLLRTRLTPPRPYRRVLARPGLLARLREAFDYRLTVIPTSLATARPRPWQACVRMRRRPSSGTVWTSPIGIRSNSSPILSLRAAWVCPVSRTRHWPC